MPRDRVTSQDRRRRKAWSPQTVLYTWVKRSVPGQGLQASTTLRTLSYHWSDLLFLRVSGTKLVLLRLWNLLVQ